MCIVVDMTKAMDAKKAVVDSDPLFKRIEEYFKDDGEYTFILYALPSMLEEITDFMDIFYYRDDYDIQGVWKDGVLMTRLRIWK